MSCSLTTNQQCSYKGVHSRANHSATRLCLCNSWTGFNHSVLDRLQACQNSQRWSSQHMLNVITLLLALVHTLLKMVLHCTLNFTVGLSQYVTQHTSASLTHQVCCWTHIFAMYIESVYLNTLHSKCAKMHTQECYSTPKGVFARHIGGLQD